MFTKLFWNDALERALSTAAQTFLVAVGGQGLDKVNHGYTVLLSAAAFGFVLSVIKSLAALKLTGGNSASLVVNNVIPKGTL